MEEADVGDSESDDSEVDVDGNGSLIPTAAT
jgi:hypothetical protein